MDLVLKDDGGEHVSAADVLGSTSSNLSPEHEDSATMQVDPDYDEGPDEQNESPALFLRKHWRKVSPESVTFECFRSPKSESLFVSLPVQLLWPIPRRTITDVWSSVLP